MIKLRKRNQTVLTLDGHIDTSGIDENYLGVYKIRTNSGVYADPEKFMHMQWVREERIGKRQNRRVRKFCAYELSLKYREARIEAREA